jgi:CheY-like chemotaxis protein
MMPKVLLADDMPAVRRAIATVLRRAGHEVEEVGDGLAARAALERGRFDVLVTDVLMPGMDGSELLLETRKRPDAPALVAVSGGSGRLSGNEALRIAESTADAALAKPFESADLLATVDRALAARRRA